ncbi:MAG: M15 family metallopeptidase [Treponemataceae bacterium]
MNAARSIAFFGISVLAFAGGASCEGRRAVLDQGASAFAAAAAESAAFVSKVERAASAAGLPADLTTKLAAAARDDRPAFEADLAAALAPDPYLTFVVDKNHPLPETYEPADIVALDTLARPSFKTNRSGHTLRSLAVSALERMAAASRAERVTLVVSSGYRSAAYQKKVYERTVAEMGKEAADRESARPGYSQHQLGLAVDFGSVTDGFAQTSPSRWLEKNASRFGWSLSFPKGYEEVTGYRWESWHYRYVGEAAAALIDRRFGGIQHYALAFLAAWRNTGDGNPRG